MDASGNLYGVTSSGGVSNYGTVFELILGQNGHYTEKRLYNFNWTNGATPVAGLIMDEAGNLYGATNMGGSYGWVRCLSCRQDKMEAGQVRSYTTSI